MPIENFIIGLGLFLAGGVAIVFGRFVFILFLKANQSEQLREAMHDLRRFKLAVEAATDAVIMTTGDTKILYANPAWEKLTGYSLDDVRGKKANILKTEKTSDEVFTAFRHALRDGTSFQSDAFVNRRKDGSAYNASLTIYPVRKGEEVLFWVGIQTDITARKRADALKSEFISLASHQLRTPLSAIRLALETLLRQQITGSLTRDQEALLTGAHHYAEMMSEILKTLLTITLMEEGKIELNREDVAVPDTLQTVRMLYEREYTNKKQTVTFACPASLRLTTDRKLLTECIGNLVSNAIHYTPMGGSISVNAQREGGVIRFDVRDTGMGIPRNTRENLFTKFSRAENARKIRPDGFGLGLYLVRLFATLMHGTVSVDSAEGKGSTFTLHLPISPPAPHDAHSDR